MYRRNVQSFEKRAMVVVGAIFLSPLHLPYLSLPPPLSLKKRRKKEKREKKEKKGRGGEEKEKEQ